MYEGIYGVGYHSKHSLAHASQIVEWLKKDWPGRTVLDIGCARGTAVKELRAAGHCAMGVDVCRVAVKAAEEEGLPVLWAPATALPFPDDAFDFTMHTDVFEHLWEEDVPKACEESLRVARRGVICKIATRRDQLRVLIPKAGLDPKRFERLHMTVRPIEWWADQYKQAGAVTVKVNKCGQNTIRAI